jgi:sn-glycerol 3-phosphate transport system permease protein
MTALEEAMEKRTTFNRWTIGVLFAVPQLLLIFTFFYWPAGQAVWWSLTLQQPWGGGNTWVGLDNFRSILSSPDYWNSIIRSTVFAALSTGISMTIGLVLAALTDRQLRGSKFYRVVLVWPYGIAAPSLGLAFRFILAPEAGIMAMLNQWWPGIWDPGLNGAEAMGAVIAAFSWKYIGYNFIFFLAAFQSIPRSLIEAASMDGSGVLRRFKDIQFPLVTPTIFFLLVINITESFQDSFGIVDIMTSGGPANSTNLMVYKIYFDGFRGLDYSGAAAQSIILKRVHYN